jgi:hypothetical protein
MEAMGYQPFHSATAERFICYLRGTVIALFQKKYRLTVFSILSLDHTAKDESGDEGPILPIRDIDISDVECQ